MQVSESKFAVICVLCRAEIVYSLPHIILQGYFDDLQHPVPISYWENLLFYIK